jgi:fatty acid desaturase
MDADSSTNQLVASKLQHPQGHLTIRWLLLDHVLVWLPTVAIFEALGTAWFIVLYPLIALCSARGLRGLECLVHDASHYNCFSKRIFERKYSDLLMNLGAALFVFSTVEGYRKSHVRHHSFLGTDKDPDWIRHVQLNLSAMRRDTWRTFLLDTGLRMFKYVPGWWAAIGTDRQTFAKSLVLHSCVVIILAVCFGFIRASLYWALGFAFPFLVVLPMLRFIGEAEEHDYVDDEAKGLSKTFTNTGFIHRMLIHPHNDGLHTLHHLYPNVPHARLPELQKFIESNGVSSITSETRVRSRVLEDL